LSFDEVLERYLRTVCRRLYESESAGGSSLPDDVRRDLREFEAVIERVGVSWADRATPPAIRRAVQEGKRVLVVYGRNDEAREKVGRFLSKLGLDPIFLDEEAAQGRTLIEKLEEQVSPVFAIVLMTGDDVGALAAEPRNLRPRARQNVILELGFFVARLGRARVCALYEEGVELPSDFRGVEYTSFDAGGAWKPKLARELYHAGVQFDPLRAL
jgi:predicted nucleotide-binding protein